MALALVQHAYDKWAERHQFKTTIYEDLAFVDVLHGGAEAFLTLANLLVAVGFLRALRDRAAR